MGYKGSNLGYLLYYLSSPSDLFLKELTDFSISCSDGNYPDDTSNINYFILLDRSSHKAKFFTWYFTDGLIWQWESISNSKALSTYALLIWGSSKSYLKGTQNQYGSV